MNAYVIVSLALMIAVASDKTSAAPPPTEFRHRAMATEFVLWMYGDKPGLLGYAAEQAFEEVDWLEQQLSIYQITSEVSGINARAATQAVTVEPGLFSLLQFSRQVWEETSGAFDVTIAPLIRTWGFFRGRGKLPDDDSIAKVMPYIGMNHLLLDAERRTVRFDMPGLEMDLGGIGKGYTVDRVVEILKRNGVTSAFVSAGGSTFYALGAPPGEKGWTIGIRDPFDKDKHVAILYLRDRSLSTSGNYEKFFQVDGRVYCHIVDPRTGRPVEGVLSATALAPTATETDALSTAFFVLGPEGTEAYCCSHKGISALLSTGDSADRFQIRRFGFSETETKE